MIHHRDTEATENGNAINNNSLLSLCASVSSVPLW